MQDTIKCNETRNVQVSIISSIYLDDFIVLYTYITKPKPWRANILKLYRNQCYFNMFHYSILTI